MESTENQKDASHHEGKPTTFGRQTDLNFLACVQPQVFLGKSAHHLERFLMCCEIVSFVFLLSLLRRSLELGLGRRMHLTLYACIHMFCISGYLSQGSIWPPGASHTCHFGLSILKPASLLQSTCWLQVSCTADCLVLTSTSGNAVASSYWWRELLVFPGRCPCVIHTFRLGGLELVIFAPAGRGQESQETAGRPLGNSESKGG